MRAPVISRAIAGAYRTQEVHHLPHSRESDVWSVGTRHEKGGTIKRTMEMKERTGGPSTKALDGSPC